MAYSVNSIKKYLLNAYSVLGTMLDTGEKIVKEQGILLMERMWTQLSDYNVVIKSVVEELGLKRIT
jgi:hypothetical protein